MVLIVRTSCAVLALVSTLFLSNKLVAIEGAVAGDDDELPLPSGPRLRDILQEQPPSADDASSLPQISSSSSSTVTRRSSSLFSIGFASHTTDFDGDNNDNNNYTTPYATVVAREYSIVTPENAMKMEHLHPTQQGVYNFTEADNVIEFANATNMTVHGHTLVWKNQNPDWVTKGRRWTRASLSAVMKDHITTVMEHYRGKVAIWDVCNEVVSDNSWWWGGSLSGSVWKDTIGNDYVDMAFRTARAADPSAILLLNEYGAEMLNRKSDRLYSLVRGMINRGVPIDGIGFQCHLTLTTGFSFFGLFRTGGFDFRSMARNLQRFADLGLEIYITELDVAVREGSTMTQFYQQAEMYRSITLTCLKQPACKAVQTWGVRDGISWIPFTKPGYDHALPFDRDFNPKPAYFAMQEALLLAA